MTGSIACVRRLPDARTAAERTTKRTAARRCRQRGSLGNRSSDDNISFFQSFDHFSVRAVGDAQRYRHRLQNLILRSAGGRFFIQEINGLSARSLGFAASRPVSTAEFARASSAPHEPGAHLRHDLLVLLLLL